MENFALGNPPIFLRGIGKEWERCVISPLVVSLSNCKNSNIYLRCIVPNPAGTLRLRRKPQFRCTTATNRAAKYRCRRRSKGFSTRHSAINQENTREASQPLEKRWSQGQDTSRAAWRLILNRLVSWFVTGSGLLYVTQSIQHEASHFVLRLITHHLGFNPSDEVGWEISSANAIKTDVPPYQFSLNG